MYSNQIFSSPLSPYLQTAIEQLYRCIDVPCLFKQCTFMQTPPTASAKMVIWAAAGTPKFLSIGSEKEQESPMSCFPQWPWMGNGGETAGPSCSFLFKIKHGSFGARWARIWGTGILLPSVGPMAILLSSQSFSFLACKKGSPVGLL